MDSYQEWDQTGGRNEANRWGNAWREKSWCDKLCMPAHVNTRVTCTVGASRVMNVSWHTLVWQTRAAVCLSADDGTGSRWTSVWSMNLWTEQLLVGVCVNSEKISACVCVFCSSLPSSTKASISCTKADFDPQLSEDLVPFFTRVHVQTRRWVLCRHSPS